MAAKILVRSNHTMQFQAPPTDNRYLAYFPEPILALQEELKHWPVLRELIANHEFNGGFEVKMVEIATFCEVIVDGAYSGEQMVQLAGILEKRLKAKRGHIEVFTVVPS